MSELTPEEVEKLEAEANQSENKDEKPVVLGSYPPPPPREPMSKLQSIAMKIAIGGAILCPLWFVIAALGVKYGLWSIGTGLVKMSFQMGPILLIAVAVICLVSLIIQLLKPPRRGSILVVIALLVPVFMLGHLKQTGNDVAGLPPIHDVQTDWTNPIQFPQALLDERKANNWNPVLDNPVVPESAAGRWPNAVGKYVKDLQAAAYQDFNLRPQLFEVKPEITIEAVVEVANKNNWDVVSVNREAGVIHATYTSPWYGFVDDIVITVEKQGQIGSRVNARSVSRIGLSDMGANATRLKHFVDDLNLMMK